jgi:glutathione S-transferase
MLEMWELGGRDGCRFSTFSWRVRLALHHKGLTFTTHAVSVSDKSAIAFSGQDKVPILKDGNHVISDSWAIALYLERAFADRPTLFGGAVGEKLTQVFNGWTDRELIPALIPYFMRDVLDCVSEVDAAHLRGQIERALKKDLENLATERDKALAVFRRKLAPVRKVLEQDSFLGGATPTYADYILFGLLQWSRVTSCTPVLEPGDAIADWFGRVLDLHGGAGREEPSRVDRMKETTA